MNGSLRLAAVLEGTTDLSLSGAEVNKPGTRVHLSRALLENLIPQCVPLCPLLREVHIEPTWQVMLMSHVMHGIVVVGVATGRSCTFHNIALLCSSTYAIRQRAFFCTNTT